MGACLELVARVVDQTNRRVFDGETVPASQKVVSLFEPHTDIIVKGGRAIEYGHKINLSTGRSGLVLDVVVEAGKPADSTRCLPMLRRHVEFYGEPPQRAAFDGGYASRENLTEAKKLGRGARGVPQEAWPGADRHDAVGMDLRPTEALSGRCGSSHLVSEALLWAGPLHLERLGSAPGVRTLGGVRPQPDEAGSLTADVRRCGQRDFRTPTVSHGP